MNWPIACQTNIWGERSLDRVIPEVGSLGLSGIEIPADALLYGECRWQDLSQLLAHHRLRPAALYVSATLGHTDRNVAAAETARVVSWLAVATACGFGILIVGDPPRRANTKIRLLAENLNALGESARDRGISLCYQPHHGGPVESPDHIRCLAAATEPATVSLCWDTAHIAWGGGDPASLIPEFAARIHYVQLKDLRRKALTPLEKLGLSMRFLGLLSRERWRQAARPVAFHILNRSAPFFVELGRGEVNLPQVLTQLVRANYEGWITIEQDRPMLLPDISMRQNIKALTREISRFM